MRRRQAHRLSNYVACYLIPTYAMSERNICQCTKDDPSWGVGGPRMPVHCTRKQTNRSHRRLQFVTGAAHRFQDKEESLRT